MRDPYPKRIICLTEETTEILYLLGEQHRIAGISGFTVRPPQARKEKPKVSAFTSADINKIIELKPDLVIGFSDIQADIARSLIAAGLEVWVTNHRSVQGILDLVVRLGALTGKLEAAMQWVSNTENCIKQIKASTEGLPKPLVYFEEWYDPLFSAILWVHEIIELSGGKNIFPELAQHSLGRDRIIADPDEVINRNPDVIIASWCGKKFVKERITARSGWQSISAVKNGHVYGMSSSVILQPGPAALTDGIKLMKSIIDKARSQ